MSLKSGEWMQLLDDQILRCLREEEPATAWEIAYSLGKKNRRARVAERCRVLADAEFVAVNPREQLGAQYELTTSGSLYLEGALDANAIRPIPGFRPAYARRPDWWAGFSRP